MLCDLFLSNSLDSVYYVLYCLHVEWRYAVVDASNTMMLYNSVFIWKFGYHHLSSNKSAYLIDKTDYCLLKSLQFSDLVPQLAAQHAQQDFIPSHQQWTFTVLVPSKLRHTSRVLVNFRVHSNDLVSQSDPLYYQTLSLTFFLMSRVHQVHQKLGTSVISDVFVKLLPSFAKMWMFAADSEQTVCTECHWKLA